MNRFTYTLSALAVCAACPAFAQTSAAELWEEWQAHAALGEQLISATATPMPDGLTLTNFTTEYDDGVVATRGSIDEITLTENPDGTVSVRYSELYSVTFSFATDPGDPPGNVEAQVRHENLVMEVSGDAGARVYAYSADRVTVTEGAVWGGDGRPPEIDVNIVMTDIQATYDITGDDPATQRFSSQGSLGGMVLAVELAPPAPEDGMFKIGLILGELTSSSSGSLVALTNFDIVNEGIPEGFEVSGEATYASLGLEMLFNDDGEAFQAVYTNDGGSIGVDFAPERISYDISATGMQTRFEGADIPFPVEVSMGSSEVSFDVPLAAGDAPQDVGLRISLQDLVMGEQLLGMMDPGQAIPRDPASFLLDATGQLQLFVDLMNIDVENMTSAPGEIRALAINEMRLSVGGADLSGTADFTFAPGQIEPMPVGVAEVQLSGGNALMDALIAGGLVPEAQGAMVRGMTSVFARPGARPDTLETTVEFGPDGSITANGIPLQ